MNIELSQYLKTAEQQSERLSSKALTPKEITQFRNTIYLYFSEFGRKLPWRETNDPYRILVSEIMLQQTQVDRVLPKYQNFVGKFPDISSLAIAPFQEVLTSWQGLGYNRRALSLHKSARIILEEFDGTIPKDIEDLIKLPGIGHATASEIAAFAYGIPNAFLETNIRTVYIYFFYKDRDDITDGELLPFVEKTLDQADPRNWYYALMDYGVMLKKQYGNPGRKSRHYAIQSPFRGSDREIRGAILRLLSQNTIMNEEEFYTELSFEKQRIKRLLTILEKEGFITSQKQQYTIY
ncbi:A/G-specific adenine glycosylase [candidate division KSB1 bacterium]